MVDEKSTVEGIFTVTGFSFAGHGQKPGLGFIRLKPWDERPGEQNGVKALARRAAGALSAIRQALTFASLPPGGQGIGSASGFDFGTPRPGASATTSSVAAQPLWAPPRRDPSLVAVRPNGLDDEAAIPIEADREIASAMGLDLADVDNTLATGWGSELCQRLHRPPAHQEGLHPGPL